MSAKPESKWVKMMMIITKLSEIINIFSGNACWELYCLEHGIQPDGQVSNEKRLSCITFKSF